MQLEQGSLASHCKEKPRRGRSQRLLGATSWDPLEVGDPEHQSKSTFAKLWVAWALTAECAGPVLSSPFL